MMGDKNSKVKEKQTGNEFVTLFTSVPSKIIRGH